MTKLRLKTALSFLLSHSSWTVTDIQKSSLLLSSAISEDSNDTLYNLLCHIVKDKYTLKETHPKIRKIYKTGNSKKTNHTRFNHNDPIWSSFTSAFQICNQISIILITFWDIAFFIFFTFSAVTPSFLGRSCPKACLVIYVACFKLP